MRAKVALCALAALLTLGVFPWYPGINNPNEMVRVYMTVALVEDGTFAIDAVERRWGWVNDKARHDGHVYSSKAPGTSYLGVPVYLVHRAISRAFGHVPDEREVVLVLRLGAVGLPWLVFLWFFCGFLQERAGEHPHLGRAVFVSVAAGSLLYAYAVTFVSHTLNAACAFGAVLALEGVPERGARAHARAALAGLLCASATLFEYPAVIATALVGALGIVRLARQPGSRARVASFLAGGVPAAIAVLAFHASAFGDPLSPGYAHLDNPSFRRGIGHGFFGASLPSPEALGRLLLDPACGLFVGTPLLLFAFPGLRRAWRRDRAATAVSIAVFVTMALFVSSLNNWRGGWTVGPRYLSTVVPFVALPALEGLLALAARRPALAHVLAAAATIVALAVSGVPSAIYPHVPESFTVPLAQLFVPLLASGRAPYSIGWLFGLTGGWSLLPLAAAALGLVALCLHGRTAGLAIGLAASILAAVLWLAPETAQQRRAVAHVERHWQPRASPGSRDGDPARAAARRGETERALRLYGDSLRR